LFLQLTIFWLDCNRFFGLHAEEIAMDIDTILKHFQIPYGGTLASVSPIWGGVIANCEETDLEQFVTIMDDAQSAHEQWRNVPAPRRGELIRIFGNLLRENKDELGMLVTIECGKIVSEGLGEVQEMIDICDFAVGLSRQLYGLTIATERPNHRMMETWHPMGVVAIISAFNFPVAVWAWNAALALVCGNSCVWKPSEKTPLTALATQHLFLKACKQFGEDAPTGLSGLIIGDYSIGRRLVTHRWTKVVSATGSTRMGRQVAAAVSGNFTRTILELGGNNAAIVSKNADLDLAIRGIAFAAMGTAGQRCTTLRRLFVHENVYTKFVPSLKAAYSSVKVGDPREPDTLIGPLIDQDAYRLMQLALEQARSDGGSVFGGTRVEVPDRAAGVYVQPAFVEMPEQSTIVMRETFAPILYVIRYSDLQDAIWMNNAADHGLSSSIFTNDLREAELFLSDAGSDCGIANVNIGPSGAEIGGAFGGEKYTGGGRESGSDSWKAYMRRATNTINYGSDLPLAQGVKFTI
jgi:aldehyde dehydrogenase (NAD+)